MKNKYATQMGPALHLGDIIKKNDVKKLSKSICKPKKHIWVISKHGRRCSRCGVEQLKTLSGEYE